jgi:hypothetical protein
MWFATPSSQWTSTTYSLPVSRRAHRNFDLTEPTYGPIEFELRDVQMVGASLSGIAMVRNLQNKRFSTDQQELRLCTVSDFAAVANFAR